VNSITNFPQDCEFQKLITRQSDVDLTTAALELARDAYPTLDFESVYDWIARRASELTSPLATAPAESQALAELGRCIAGQHGITGSRESYDEADGSFLHRVIERQCGIPISLSVLYMAVASRAGWRLRGVSAPGHFLVRYDSIDGPLFLDPFDAGRVLSISECLGRVQKAAGVTSEMALSALKPVGPRTIITRMLNNLKALYARQSQWQGAWMVQRRLVALQPTSYNERRDLALLTLKAGQAGKSLDLLQACRRTCPQDEMELLDQQMDDARRQIARWN